MIEHVRPLAPVLVCLNLQRPYVDPSSPCYAPRGAEALINAGACVAWARRQLIPVWHVHTHNLGSRSAPIPGFEPRPNEKLLTKRSWSLFDSADIAQASPALEHAFVVGFTASRDCLATAIDAERAGAKLVFVTDAIASARISAQPIEIFEEVLSSLLGDWAHSVTTASLLRRQPKPPVLAEARS